MTTDIILFILFVAIVVSMLIDLMVNGKDNSGDDDK